MEGRQNCINYFCEKAPSHIFDWVLNTSLAGMKVNRKSLKKVNR